MKKPGRPKKPDTPIVDLSLSSYQKDITIFRNSLIDCLEEPEYQDKKETIQKFLSLPLYQQNIFIIYLIKDATISKLAELLECDRTDIYRIIVNTKKELRNNDNI